MLWRSSSVQDRWQNSRSSGAGHLLCSRVSPAGQGPLCCCMRDAASCSGRAISLVCDGKGCPLPLSLTAGTGGGGIAKPCYNANPPRNWLKSVKATTCIPTQNSDKVQVGQNIDLSKLRDILERMFEFLKNWQQLRLRRFHCRYAFRAAAHAAGTDSGALVNKKVFFALASRKKLC